MLDNFRGVLIVIFFAGFLSGGFIDSLPNPFLSSNRPTSVRTLLALARHTGAVIDELGLASPVLIDPPFNLRRLSREFGLQSRDLSFHRLPLSFQIKSQPFRLLLAS
jgi:hypothetical protein